MRLSQADRTIYELLRVAIVDAGYLPDVTLFNNADDYKAAKQVITDSGKELIELFGVGAAEKRDVRSFCKIVINRKNVKRGSMGAVGLTMYDEVTVANVTTFKKTQMPDYSADVEYELRVICEKASYDRICFDIILSALGQTKYVKAFDDDALVMDWDDDQNVLINSTILNMDLSQEDMIERMYRYEMVDCWVQAEKLISSGSIVPITSIEWCLYTVPNMLDLNPDNADWLSCGNGIQGVAPVVPVGPPIYILGTNGDIHGTHSQNLPESVWVVTHNHGFHPVINVYDLDGNVLTGYERDDVSTIELTLTFSTPQTGKVILS